VSALYYGPALRELVTAGELRLSHVFDPDRVAAERIASCFRGSEVADSFEAVCRSEADLVIVASPPTLHASQTIELLDAGRSVLCEKPLATSVADAERMVAAAVRRDRLLAAGMVRRFLPAAQVIREIVASRLLGDLRSLEWAEGSATFGWPVSSRRYFSRSYAGGGVLMDIGVHVLDLLTWWFGEPAEIKYRDDVMGGVEANALVSVRFPGGMTGSIRLSRDTQLANCLLIRGGHGWLRWSESLGEKLEIGIEGSRYVLDATLRRCSRGRTAVRVPAYNFEQCFVAQLRNVLAAVRGEDRLFVSAETALGSIALVERCYGSRTLMRMGWLEASEEGRAQHLQRGSS
jgi:predicted dehydrogenase